MSEAKDPDTARSVRALQTAGDRPSNRRINQAREAYNTAHRASRT